MRVLVISAHPDDETLGCGGSLLRHREAGDEVHWLIATRATSPRWPADLVERKAREVEAVAEAYAVKAVHHLGFPPAALDTIPQSDLITAVGSVAGPIRPELVYVVHPGDAHSDHRALAFAAFSVLKPFHMTRLGVRRALCFETLSSTDAAASVGAAPFCPDVFHDITAHIDRKIEIMRLYGSEAQPDPLPRGPSAIRAHARSRGATVGLEYAEAFMLVREIV
jgi:N-acetylglucosamine malate deacetylase 1